MFDDAVDGVAQEGARALVAEDADGFDDVAWLECGALGRVDAQAVVAFLHDDHFARDVAEHRAHDTHAEELLK